MRVLQLHSRYRERGGEDTTVENEGEVLREAGHHVKLHEVQNPASAEAALRLAVSTWNPRAAKAVAAELAEFSPDVVHAHNLWFSLTPSVLREARQANVPTVMTFQNYRLVCVSSNLFRDGGLCEDCVGRGPWSGVRHGCYRDSRVISAVSALNIAAHRAIGTWAREVDVVVAVSTYGRERHVAGGVPQEKIVVKNNFAPDPGRRTTQPSASDRVLFVGRGSPEKGLDLLIEAWRCARPQGLVLEVIGGGRNRDSEGPDAHGIHFRGPLSHEDVVARMLESRALAVPSQWPEGQPLVILEGLAAGLPVIGTAIGGIEEVLSGDPLARLVPLGDRPGWSRAISELTSPAECDNRGASSRALYERSYTPAVGLDRLLEVYELARARRLAAQCGRRPST